MILKMKYSCIMARKKVDRKLVEEVFKLIEDGIKITLIIPSTNIESYIGKREEEYIERLKENGFLRIYYLNGNFFEFNIEDGIRIEKKHEEILGKIEFNIEQFKAEHMDLNSDIIIKAGAGTGKTKVLIDRILYLIHMKPDLDLKKIVMLTFTNEATVQMKNKLIKKLKAYFENTKKSKYLDFIENISDIKIRTIHSFSKHLLDKVYYELGYSKDISIRSYKYDKKRLIENSIHKYRMENQEQYKSIIEDCNLPLYKVIDAFLYIQNYIDNRGLDILKIDFGKDYGFDRGFSNFIKDILIDLNMKLQNKKYIDNSLEVNDLIKNLDKIKCSKESSKKFDFEYIMIDEFQDTDDIQLNFMAAFANSLGIKTFVVGDEKQSIYRFRGADHGAFEKWENRLGKNDRKTETIILHKNYRSVDVLLNKLNQMFLSIKAKDNNQWLAYFKFDETDCLTPTRNGKDKGVDGFHIINYNTDAGLEKGLLENIEGLKEKKEAEEEAKKSKKNEEEEGNHSTAILVRTNDQLEKLERILEKTDLKYKIDIDGEFYRTKAVKDFYALIQGMIYEQSYSAQVALFNSSYGSGVSYKYVLSQYSADTDYMKRVLRESPDYLMFKKYREDFLDKPFFEVVYCIIQDLKPHVRFASKYNKRREYELKRYKGNLYQLLYILESEFLDSEVTIMDIGNFLKIKILTDKTESERSADSNEEFDVVAMTIHKSKGLEFDHVIIPYLYELMVTHKNYECVLNGNKLGYKIKNIKRGDDEFFNNYFKERSKDEERESIAEEVRVLYVGMTRAKNSLSVCMKDSLEGVLKIKNWSDLIERESLDV
jgi:DNA helicase-2/ATP-dependent DNA helicase PcrA